MNLSSSALAVSLNTDAVVGLVLTLNTLTRACCRASGLPCTCLATSSASLSADSRVFTSTLIMVLMAVLSSSSVCGFAADSGVACGALAGSTDGTTGPTMGGGTPTAGLGAS